MFYNCIGVIGVKRRCPAVDDGARILGWASKRLRRKEQQNSGEKALNNTQHFPLLREITELRASITGRAVHRSKSGPLLSLWVRSRQQILRRDVGDVPLYPQKMG